MLAQANISPDKRRWNRHPLSLLPKYIAPSAWWEHVPIAHWLIAELRPGSVVELGTHYGVSFFAFCEAAEYFSPNTFIYAVDTWKGDEHSGAYGEEVYMRVNSHWQKFHKARSRLVRSTFDDAAKHFQYQSIDLLHIDGLHTYEAVSHDFNTWLPLLSPGGSILFHDINVRERDFGVFQVWNELKQLPNFQCVEVLNGHGLGIATYSANTPSWHVKFMDLIEVLTSKGSLLDELALLKPEGISPEECLIPYRLQAKTAKEDADRWHEEVLVAQARADQCRVEAEQARSEMMAEHTSEITRLCQVAVKRNDEITSLIKAVAKRNDEIASLNEAVTKRDDEVVSLNRSLAELLWQVANMEQSRSWRITGSYRSIGDALKRALGPHPQKGGLSGGPKVMEPTKPIPSVASETVSQSDPHIASLNQSFAELRWRVADIEQSRSWQITRPYRAIGDAVKGFFGALPQKPVLAEKPQVVEHTAHPTSLSAEEVALRDDDIADLNRSLTELRSRIADMEQSRSWSITRPYRALGDVVKGSLGAVPRSAEVACVPRFTEHTAPTGAAPNELVCGDVTRRILVADYRIPRSDVSAGERATVGILKDLCALGFDVVLLPDDMAPFKQYEAELHAFGVEVVTRDSGYGTSRDYVANKGHQFSCLYVIRVDVAESILRLFREVAPAARVIFHAPDLYHVRELREAALHDDVAGRERALAIKERELAMMRLADEVVVVSPAEAPILQAELPDMPITVFPVLYAPILPVKQHFEERRNLFFLGGFSHTPNVSAVQWFAAEVWPIVRQSLPDVEFYMLGAEAPNSVVALCDIPGIRFVGFVQNLDPLLEIFRLGVAPLLFGAGIKGKVATTMGAGIPCVCTEIATEGMGIEDGVHALVADDPQKFADAIVSLYTDSALWERLSKNGQVLVQERFGDEANRAALLKVLDKARALPLSLFADYCREAAPLLVPSPGADEIVDVSIVVPVFNKWELTRACLTSVVQTSVGSRIRYEVILADDGSSDDTLRAAEIFPGLRVVRTPSNLGFLLNCNNAAKHARGRYLLLLNNDTVVLPGWLKALYQAIETDPSAAIVGSKLLYPDGVIQEAGAALFSDGTATNVGRGSGRYAEVFNLSREVDYVSGASILIRASFWSEVGGFDECYKDAYCEDCDLAISARAKGMRVVYEPRSEAIHFEHGTYAEQAPSHSASLQRHNTEVLVSKWHKVFKTQHLARCDWQLAASLAERSIPAEAAKRRRSGRLKILYFSPFPSHPASHGNRARIQNLARRFQQLGHCLHFVLLQSNDFSECDLTDMEAAWDSLDVLPYTNSMIENGKEIPFDGWYEQGLGERIRVLCAKYDIDLVFCSYVFQSKLLEFVPQYILKVIDAHDKMGDRYEMLRRNGQHLEFFSCSPEEEGAYLRRADIVVALREEEARYFNLMSGLNTAIVISHIENPHFVNKSFTALLQVGIVASANRVNLAMVCEFLQSLGHQLNGRPCPFTVHVAGQVKDMISSLPPEQAEVFKQPWVRLRGFVPDIAVFYSEIDVVVSPVTMGTGINVKTVQAMAYGMPLLTTACGSKGIETDEMMHNHPNVDSLVSNLLRLSELPTELGRLACVSRERYQRFFDESTKNIEVMFSHPKLLVL